MGEIYTITSLINNKIYVGYCSDFEKRKASHYSNLKHNSHDNAHLQSSYNLYGKGSIIFEILDECQPEFFCSLEHYWCNILDTHNDTHGFNITHPYDKHKRQSEETKRKIGEAHKGKTASETSKKRMSLAQTGKKQHEETKQIHSI